MQANVNIAIAIFVLHDNYKYAIMEHKDTKLHYYRTSSYNLL